MELAESGANEAPIIPDSTAFHPGYLLPQGGDKGGYKNPNGPESLHPDLDHGGDIGPHWDFNDRNGPGYRIGPDGTIWPK
jgi:hypothetical protein